MLTSRTTYFVLLFGAFLWCGLILLAPYLAASSSPFAEFVYRFFQPICHQRPERSFHLVGEKLAVCVRCSSIYFSFLVGVVLYPFVRGLHNTRTPSRALLFATLSPIVLEVASEWVGLYQSSALTRSLTGAFLGFILSFIVLPVALEAAQQLSNKSSTIMQP
jgi:uncharacterized membrane protein